MKVNWPRTFWVRVARMMISVRIGVTLTSTPEYPSSANSRVKTSFSSAKNTPSATNWNKIEKKKQSIEDERGQSLQIMGGKKYRSRKFVYWPFSSYSSGSPYSKRGWKESNEAAQKRSKMWEGKPLCRAAADWTLYGCMQMLWDCDSKIGSRVSKMNGGDWFLDTAQQAHLRSNYCRSIDEKAI